jgi:hypothetical protein
MLGDALCDADHEVQLSLYPFQDGLGCKRGRHIDDRGIRARGCHGFLLQQKEVVCI